MTMKRNIVLQEDYPYPPERVWAALTNSDALAAWLMENDFQPYVGHRFQFRTHASPGFDGMVDCEVITVDKPHKLAYTWQGGPMKKPTVVTWTLEPIPQGTRLQLEHTGFEGLVGIGISYLLGRGWRKGLRVWLPDLIRNW